MKHGRESRAGAKGAANHAEQVAELEMKRASMASGSQDAAVKIERQVINMERVRLEHRQQEAQSTERAQAAAIERHREEVASLSNSRVTSARSAANAEAILILRRDFELQSAANRQQAEHTTSTPNAIML